MARKRKPRAQTGRTREYRFEIGAYSPSSFPLARLSEYLKDLADLFGEDKFVHFDRLEEGSTTAIVAVEREAEPKVRKRLQAVKRKNGPPEAMRAAKNIDDRLRMDNTKGAVIDPVESNLLYFPGVERKVEPEYGPLNQLGSIDGIPIVVGGEEEIVPVHLEDQQGQRYICRADRAIAADIGRYLFTHMIRAEGVGRWLRRADGEWQMVSFRIKTFRELPPMSVRDAVQRFRDIPAEWKNLADPLGEIRRFKQKREM